MAEKAAGPVRKTKAVGASAKKSAPAPAKRSTTRTIAKDESLVCEVCGLSILVDEYNGYVEETTLVCCGVPMKNKVGRARRKAAAKK